MLVALIGPACSGKLEVAKYLVVHHNFRPAFIGEAADVDARARRALDRRWSELVPLCQSNESGVLNGSRRKTDTHSKDGKPFMFETGQTLLDHATSFWRDNIVTLDLTTRNDLEIGFDKRPFFLLIGVDAPLTLRWRRTKSKDSRADDMSLESFVAADDVDQFGENVTESVSRSSSSRLTPSATTSSPHTPVKGVNGTLLKANATLFAPDTPSSIGNSNMYQVVQPNGLLASRAPPRSLRELMQACTLIVHNTFSTLASLHSHLASLNLTSNDRLRPSWDTYFLSLCTLASLRSNCMKRRVGAVLVRNNRVLSTGYNGTPRGLQNCAEGGCSRCNGGAAGGTALDECLCLHAEENALLECGRERGGADGTVLYCNTCPCLRCAVKIVQTGVREVVYQLAYSMDDRSRQIFREANVLFRQYQPT